MPTRYKGVVVLDTLLPSAGDFANKVALAEADEAAKESRARHQAELEQQALLDQLKKPWGVSDEEAIQRAVKMIEGAVRNRRQSSDRGSSSSVSQRALYG